MRAASHERRRALAASVRTLVDTAFLRGTLVYLYGNAGLLPRAHELVQAFRIIIEDDIDARLEYAAEVWQGHVLLGEPPVVLDADDSRIDNRALSSALLDAA